MILLTLILIPFAGAAVIALLRNHPKAVRSTLFLTALALLYGMIVLDCDPNVTNCTILFDYLQTDLYSKVVATVTSVLFFCSALYGCFWLPLAREHEKDAMKDYVFAMILCAFVSMMTLAAFSANFGILWVAVEATTLASAPLIRFHRSQGALEAMWKYLLICSVGIGLALFGTFILELAVRASGIDTLDFVTLAFAKNKFHPEWFKVAFVFIFAGYGLKMGLAPFHTWLPDAHSEAPAMISVLLSGALLNCSFLGIIRILNVTPDALLPFCRELLIGFGILSLITAAFFLIRQSDFKRMLAYSSVEHMGLLAIFWGLGATNTALAHLSMHSVCKMILFLTAGNILLSAGTRKVESVSGLFRNHPRTAAVWFIGVLMICGMPPSPLFVTEFLLVKYAGPVLGGLILILLFLIFGAMTHTVLKMTAGKDNAISPVQAAHCEKLSILPAVLLVIPAAAGCYLIYKMIVEVL